MLRNIVTFHHLATQAVERSSGSDGHKVTFNTIKQKLGKLMYEITSQKFEDPSEGEDAIRCWPLPGGARLPCWPILRPLLGQHNREPRS